MLVLTVVLVMALEALTGFAAPEQGERSRPTAPESFSANANVTGGAGAAATRIAIQLDRYSPAADRDTVVQALTTHGYAAFLEALRQASPVGTLTLAGESFSIHWAREERSATGRTIVLVTDKPVYSSAAGARRPSRAMATTWPSSSSRSTMRA